MADIKMIEQINKVIEEYFKANPALMIIPVKKLMPAFIDAGIFQKDIKNGQPIRKVLRELDKTDKLTSIPFVYAERNENDVYWYFIPSEAEAPTRPYKQEEKKPESEKDKKYYYSDVTYVINLCDEVLNQKANRQKRFGFLLGDYHKDGKTRTSLPVDAFYQELNLVVEYREKPMPEKSPEKLASLKKTISGVTRDEQRKLYDERKEEVLPENNIDLIIIRYSEFSLDKNNKIERDEEKDLKAVRNILKEFL